MESTGPALLILKAVYGTQDITDNIQSRVSHNQLDITANNDLAGDSWAGIRKSFVVFYQFKGTRVFTQLVAEGEHILIKYDHSLHITASHTDLESETEVIGAVFGLTDVTLACRRLLHTGKNEIHCNNETFGDGWPGISKTFVIFYRLHGNSHLEIRKEGESVTIK